MTVLTQFGLEGGHLGQGAASLCNYAGQMRYKQPWSPQSNAATILLLPCFERGFFDSDDVTSRNDVVNKLAVQAFPMSSQFALGVSVLPSCRLIALAVVPLLLARLYPSLFIIVVRIVGSALPIHLALE